MSLPKWVKESFPWDNPDDGSKVLEALSVAWEALEYFAYRNADEEDLNAVNAMRRIEELGK